MPTFEVGFFPKQWGHFDLSIAVSGQLWLKNQPNPLGTGWYTSTIKQWQLTTCCQKAVKEADNIGCLDDSVYSIHPSAVLYFNETYNSYQVNMTLTTSSRSLVQRPRSQTTFCEKELFWRRPTDWWLALKVHLVVTCFCDVDPRIWTC